MARQRPGRKATKMVSAITTRAGAFIEMAHPGAHKNKRIAQLFAISPDMAKLLRRGEGWTAERIGQAASHFGRDFVAFVFQDVMGPARPYEPDPEILALKSRVARVEARVGVDDGVVAPPAGTARREPMRSVEATSDARGDEGGGVGPQAVGLDGVGAARR